MSYLSDDIDIHIEKGVDIPKFVPGTHGAGKVTTALMAMDVGDSFIIRGKLPRDRVMSSCARIQKVTDRVYTTRKMTKVTWRCWRTK